MLRIDQSIDHGPSRVWTPDQLARRQGQRYHGLVRGLMVKVRLKWFMYEFRYHEENGQQFLFVFTSLLL